MFLDFVGKFVKDLKLIEETNELIINIKFCSASSYQNIVIICIIIYVVENSLEIAYVYN